MEGRLHRDGVQHWLVCWPQLDGLHGKGHARQLEEVLLDLARDTGKLGFRAVWVVALLLQSGWQSPVFGEHSLFELLNVEAANDEAALEGRRRELTRALLCLQLSDEGLMSLVDWAVHVVHLPGAKPAAIHQALQSMELASQRPLEVIEGRRVWMVEALSEIKRHSNKKHHKKKAERTLARLSLLFGGG